MNDDLFLELSNYAGLIATVVLTFNFLLGTLLASAYKRSIYWKKLPAKLQQIDINDLHNWTAYVAFLLIAMHVMFLISDTASKFTYSDIFYPFNAPTQAFAVTLGSIALYALIIVIITTQKVIKKKMSFRLWKNIHLISYGMAILFVVHGTLLDQHLKGGAVDYFDGEKVLSEACGLLLVAASIIRYRYHVRKD